MTTKIKSTSLEDNAVTTAKIASDAVTAAKIPANAIGSSELDLTANYTFTGTVAGTSDMVLLNTTTVSEATAEVAFTNLFDDAYETFIIRGTEITSNASSDQDDFLAFKARGCLLYTSPSPRD